MIFNNKAISFGRNETFLLRYNWIFKGLSSLKHNEDIFNSPNALSTLGVGKNMMNSMRYWLSAYKLLDTKSKCTSFAEYIFDPDVGQDPFLEDPTSLWLLHWKLCTNPEKATLYFWFFNIFAKTSFTKLELQTALEDWLKFQNTKSVSPKTLERDVNLLLRTYSSINVIGKEFEDQLENPFHELRMISKNIDGTFGCYIQPRESLSPYVLGFCIAEIQTYFSQSDLLSAERDFSIIPVSEILNSSEFPSIQKIFKVTEEHLFYLLSSLEKNYPNLFQINETAGQKNLFIKQSLESQKFLKDYYEKNL